MFAYVYVQYKSSLTDPLKNYCLLSKRRNMAVDLLELQDFAQMHSNWQSYTERVDHKANTSLQQSLLLVVAKFMRSSLFVSWQVSEKSSGGARCLY